MNAGNKEQIEKTHEFAGLISYAKIRQFLAIFENFYAEILYVRDCNS